MFPIFVTFCCQLGQKDAAIPRYEGIALIRDNRFHLQ